VERASVAPGDEIRMGEVVVKVVPGEVEGTLVMGPDELADIPASAIPPASAPPSQSGNAITVPPRMIVQPPAAPPVTAVSLEARCLSVNALPFAEVYVDDRSVGYTPAACLRVPMGEHRIRFEMDGQRSPERLLRITARHTPNAPMRISYDFNTGRFIEQ